MIKRLLPILLALLLACAPALAADKPETNAQGMPLVPNFTLQGRDGQAVSLSDHLGKQVVLYFWATWCPYCLDGMPDDQAVYERIVGDDLPIAYMAINLTDGRQETRAKADAFLDEHGYTLPVYYDEGLAVSSGIFGVESIPVTLVIDEQGYLKNGRVGTLPASALWAMLGVEP
ncbi:MAG: TlpA family protein disulfide reductase [Oscillospiraceae bacterium]|jgi:peroxiredoxin|nr:TlpA family protein disulfide reductase [Oscillospiraceae bacterium]